MPRVLLAIKTWMRWRYLSAKALGLSTGGFSIVEVLLAVVVFGLLASGLMGAIVYGRASSDNAGNRSRAIMLAEEGIEAARNVAAANFANLPDGTYGLAQVANQWTASGTSDVQGIYTRQVIISTPGTDRKNITSTVSWPAAGNTTNSVTVTTRLVNWTAATTQWSNAIQADSADVVGTANAVKTKTVGNYAYTVLNAATNNLVITDISNPAAIINVSTTSLAGTPTNIFVSGNYAYITNTSDTAELQVVDISVPTAPVLKASVNLAGTGNSTAVYLSGSYAYVARVADATAGANELAIVNISAPLAPVVTGGYDSTLTFNDVYVAGVNAYVSTSATATEMLVINATIPAAPTLRVAYNAPGNNSALAVTGFGNTVLLGTGATLVAVNVTAPATPTLLGSFTGAGVINSIDYNITNQFAFLGTASTTGEFQVVNIAAPASMTLAKTIDVAGAASTIGGVSYNTTYDSVVGASAADTLEILTFIKN